MTELGVVALGLMLGAVAGVALLLPIMLILGARRNRDGEFEARLRAERLRIVREEQLMRLHRAVAGISNADACLVESDNQSESERILYSPEAREEIARLNVSDEHVEMVLAYPESRPRSAADCSIQLERDFGRRTLRVMVAEPWPTFGTAYVKRVEWRVPNRRKRWARTVRGLVARRVTRRWVETEGRNGLSLWSSTPRWPKA